MGFLSATSDARGKEDRGRVVRTGETRCTARPLSYTAAEPSYRLAGRIAKS
jgi:hypothetical protein